MASSTAGLRIKLGRVATGNMTAGSSILSGLGFSALPWEGSGPTVQASDAGTEITIIGAGPSMPFTPAFGPVGQMLCASVLAKISDTSLSLPVVASNNTQPGAANVTLFREISWALGSLSVDYSLTSIARSTMTFSIKARSGAMVAIEGMPVMLIDDTLGYLWGGAIDIITVTNETGLPGSLLTFECQCVSWAYMLQRRPINPYVLTGGVFSSRTLQYTCEHLVYDYCDSEGLSVNCPVGPTLDLDVSGKADTTVAGALDQACAKASTATDTYTWYVDMWRVVQVILVQSVAAPFHISDADHTNKNMLVKYSYVRDRSKLINSVYIEATDVLGATLTETYTGDGTNKTFSTTQPIGSKPSVTVGGVAKTVGISNGGSLTFDWYWSLVSPTITQDPAASPVGTGVSVVIVYQPGTTQLLSATNSVSVDRQCAIESGTGFSYAKTTYGNPIAVADAPTMVQASADSAADVPKEFTIKTLQPGLAIGQTLQITLAQLSLSTQGYLIDKVKLTTGGGQLQWEAHCVNGPLIGDFIRGFNNLSGGGGNSIGGGGGGSAGVPGPAGPPGPTAVPPDNCTIGTATAEWVMAIQQ